MYWHERFCVEVGPELINHIMPFIQPFRQKVEALGTNAGTSMRSVMAACDYMAAVAVQDALELHDLYPDHPVHKLLGQHSEFR
jgi:hypothetical protein